jgi:1,4-dihydroxy-2-naphthoate octaprenyltransferase
MRIPNWILGPMRVPFLILTPACVLVGIGTAVWSSAELQFVEVLLVLIGAIASHISVNAFNEYFDFKSGLDMRTRRTPFSGGSGTLPDRPEAERSALTTALAAFTITAIIGIYFLFARGPLLLPVGIVGLSLLVGYTVWLIKNPVLCLIAPGLGFGVLMVMGTHFALTGEYSWPVFLASLVPTFLVSNLLLINQFPDLEADESVGRRHFPIVLGRSKSAWIYVSFLVSTFLVILLGVIFAIFPPLTLLGLLGLVLAIPTMRGAVRFAEDVEKLIPVLSQNVLLTLLIPTLFAIGFFVG